MDDDDLHVVLQQLLEQIAAMPALYVEVMTTAFVDGRWVRLSVLPIEQPRYLPR